MSLSAESLVSFPDPHVRLFRAGEGLGTRLQNLVPSRWSLVRSLNNSVMSPERSNVTSTRDDRGVNTEERLHGGRGLA